MLSFDNGIHYATDRKFGYDDDNRPKQGKCFVMKTLQAIHKDFIYLYSKRSSGSSIEIFVQNTKQNK